MATIAGILEGKTGNYFKLEDFGDDSFRIIESIDPNKTEIRTEKVKNTNKDKKEGDKAETEYYHILTKCGDVEKDLSMTFTALKQLAGVMPKDENWLGYDLKYLGTKGSGKNIKYNFQVIGKRQGEQARIGDSFAPKPEGETSASKIQRILTILLPPGVHDSKIEDKFLEVFGTKEAGEFAFGMLKSEGKITQRPDKCWVKV
jgi:hypothetical protein